MGAIEVAKVLDVWPSNLQDIKDLPAPLFCPRGAREGHLGCGRVWLAQEIDEFARKYKARRAARRSKRNGASPDALDVPANGRQNRRVLGPG